MRISLRIAGGLIGRAPTVYGVETEQLPERVAKRIEQQVSAADVFALPDRQLTPYACDLQEYEFTFEDGPQSHRVLVDDLSISAPLRGLAQMLQELI